MIDDRWQGQASSDWRQQSSSSAFSRRPDLTPGERLAVVETRQDQHGEMHRTHGHRFVAIGSRMDHIERRIDRLHADHARESEVRAARELDKKHREELCRDAIRGAALLLTALAFVGALLGKVPWEAVKSLGAGALGK